MKRTLQILILTMLTLIVMAAFLTALADETEHTFHYAYCTSTDVCAIGGEPYAGSQIRHPGNFHYEHDDNTHWMICDDCGDVYIEPLPHHAYCTAPDVCSECGAPYSGDLFRHPYDGETYAFDKYSHWTMCGYCGVRTEEPCAHYTSCDKPGVCAECGAPFSGGELLHLQRFDVRYAHDDEKHWTVCPACEEPGLDAELHIDAYAYCDDPEVCAVCNGPYTGKTFEHRGTYHYESDADSHRKICDICGETIGSGRHIVTCVDPSECRECGEPCSSGIVHHRDDESEYGWGYDEHYHWRVCEACHDVVASGDSAYGVHYASCGMPGVCAICDRPYGGSNVRHVDRKIVHDDTYHWWVCVSCGEICDANGFSVSYDPRHFGEACQPEAHYASCYRPGVCAKCDLPYEGDNIRHASETRLVSDANGHWWACASCGEIAVGPFEHAAWCMEPGVCATCGEPCVGEHVEHNPNRSADAVIQHDKDSHWYLCDTCGLTYGVEAHTVLSKDDGLCLICGATGLRLSSGTTVSPASLSGDFTVGSPITATMNAKNAYAFNYWLFNEQGVIVKEHTNTTDTTWTFTVDEPGIYLLRTYATNFESEDWTDTEWFAIEGTGTPAPAVTVSNVTVSGDYRAGASLTGTASIENGLAFNYWLFNDQGVIVAEHTNTTDTAWNFSVATPGLYLLRMYATDFLTEDWDDSEWFYITQAAPANPVVVSSASLSEANIHVGDTMTVVPSVSGGSGLYAYNYWVFNANGVIVKEKTNTLDSSASFTFTEPGVYLIRVYATDFESEDYTDSLWFSVI